MNLSMMLQAAPVMDTCTSAGQYDMGYGVAGRASAECPQVDGLGAESIAYASTMDAAGRLILAGHSFNTNGGLVASITRLRVDGTSDAEFGTHGFATLPARLSNGDAWLRQIAAGRNGGLLVGFDIRAPDQRHVAVRRLDSCGAPVGDEHVVLRLSPGSRVDMLDALLASDDGSFLVLATTQRNGIDGKRPVLMRLTQDGLADESFGEYAPDLGRACADLEGQALRFVAPWMIAAAPCGQCVFAAHVESDGQPAGIALLRFDAQGRRDRYFGRHGVARIPGSHGTLRRVLIAPDGGVVLVLQSTATGTFAVPKVLRLTADGVPDGAFGRGGTTLAPFRIASNHQRPAAAALQSDGKVVLAGTPWSGTNGQQVVVSRLQADGRCDEEFGDTGTVVCGFEHDPAQRSVSVDSIAGMHVDRDRILVAGHMLECEVKYRYSALALHC